MRIDQVLLTLHILATATWVGAALALQVIGGRMRSPTRDAAADGFALDAEAVGKTVFAPSAVVLLVTGVVLVERQNLGWATPWILIGVGLLAVVLAVGGAFLIPEGRRIAELARTPDHDPAEVRDRTTRRLRVARVDLALLIVAVADMVFRPGG